MITTANQLTVSKSQYITFINTLLVASKITRYQLTILAEENGPKTESSGPTKKPAEDNDNNQNTPTTDGDIRMLTQQPSLVAPSEVHISISPSLKAEPVLTPIGKYHNLAFIFINIMYIPFSISVFRTIKATGRNDTTQTSRKAGDSL